MFSIEYLSTTYFNNLVFKKLQPDINKRQINESTLPRRWIDRHSYLFFSSESQTVDDVEHTV